MLLTQKCTVGCWVVVVVTLDVITQVSTQLMPGMRQPPPPPPPPVITFAKPSQNNRPANPTTGRQLGSETNVVYQRPTTTQQRVTPLQLSTGSRQGIVLPQVGSSSQQQVYRTNLYQPSQTAIQYSNQQQIYLQQPQRRIQPQQTQRYIQPQNPQQYYRQQTLQHTRS